MLFYAAADIRLKFKRCLLQSLTTEMKKKCERRQVSPVKKSAVTQGTDRDDS